MYGLVYESVIYNQLIDFIAVVIRHMSNVQNSLSFPGQGGSQFRDYDTVIPEISCTIAAYNAYNHQSKRCLTWSKLCGDDRLLLGQNPYH